MEQRISVVTLGVADLGRSQRFYEGLGWTTRGSVSDGVLFFEAGGMVLALWDQESLAEDSGSRIGEGFGRITLAHNVAAPKQVDAVLEQAESAGARITRPGGETFWGGYSGVFSDPDGHHWEVAHNPHWTLAEDGSVSLPD